ncbi:DNA-binding response regulator [Opitutaceae bacterium EW11]|nr:DNA-binding response regulator [Opitutaceae bacterium EW11]
MKVPSPKSIRVLVVDDEQPARQRLLDLLRKDARVGCIHEAENGLAAVDAIRDEKPDLVFLDIQMPGLDGWGTLAEVGADQMPLTIFVTAYDRHAIRAFEANALDYLPKPYSDERFAAALARAHERLADDQYRDFGQQVFQMMAREPAADAFLDRIVVKSGATTRLLPVAEIDWIESSGVYVNLHTGSKTHLHRTSLQELAGRLDPTRFVRVHRSAIVNLASILHLVSLSHGEFELVLKNGARTRVSRSYRAELEKRLGQSL